MHTPASVEKELRRLLTSGAVVLRSANLTNEDALVVLGHRPHMVLVDPIGKSLENIIHELLHSRFTEADLKVWSGEFDEAHTVGRASVVVRYINRSKTRIDWWRNAIAKRLS